MRLFDPPQKSPFLRENELAFLGRFEVCGPGGIGRKPGSVALVVGKAVEGNQCVRNIVGPCVRHPIAQQIAATAWDDLRPPLGILLELTLLERIKLIANEYRDAHGRPLAAALCAQGRPDASAGIVASPSANGL